MILLGCGSRTWGVVPMGLAPAELQAAVARVRAEQAAAFFAVEALVPDVLVHGAAVGADTVIAMVAGEWARAAGRICVFQPYPADWDRDGTAAGPIRNVRMLEEGHPDRGLALGALWKPDPRRTSGKNPGYRLTGTGDMVQRMVRAWLPVRWIARHDAPAVDLTKMPGPTS